MHLPLALASDAFRRVAIALGTFAFQLGSTLFGQLSLICRFEERCHRGERLQILWPQWLLASPRVDVNLDHRDSPFSLAAKASKMSL